MAEQFYTILTNIGKAKIANAGALGIKVDLSTLVLGDGNGSYYNPTETQTKLINEVYRRNINNVNIDSANPNWIVVETIVPSAEGGFTIREVGCLDTTGDLIVVGKYPETYKPKVEDGAVKDLTVKIIMEVSNAENVIIKIDPSVTLATKKDLEEATKAVSKTYEELKQMIQDKKLIQGRKYLLTDYKTKYQQPTTNVIKEMPIEQLVLTANSNNSFEPIVSSPTYPQDVIYYNFNDNKCEDNTTDRTGFIQRRTDTITKNDCPHDWRTMLWARYKPDTTQYYKDGVLTAYKGWYSGNAVLEVVYKSGNSLYMAKNTNVPTSAIDTSVFYKVYEDINVGMLIKEKTKIADKIELKKDELHERLTFGNNCSYNNIGNSAILHNNIFGDNCNQNVLNIACTRNTFGNSNTSNNMFSGVGENILFEGCSINRFGNNCYENILFNGSRYNSFGNMCYKNILGTNFTSNSLGNGCYSNVFGDSCNNNSLDNGCAANVFGRNCSANNIINCTSSILGDILTNLKILSLNGKNISNINDIHNKLYDINITRNNNNQQFIYWYLNASNQPVYTVIP